MNEDELIKFKKKCRHKLEIPIYFFSIILNIVIISLITYFGIICIENSENIKYLASFLEVSEEIAGNLTKFGKFIAIVFIIITYGKIFWTYFRDVGRTIGWDTHITEEQFKEYYDISIEYAKKLGLKKPISTYISDKSNFIETEGFRIFNIFSLRLVPDFISVTYEKNELATVKYDLAYHYAEKFLGYHKVLYYLLIGFVFSIPIVNELVCRTMCYSIDKVVRELMGEEEMLKGYILKLQNPWVMLFINREEYIKDKMKNLSFLKKCALFVENLLSPVPIPKYRIEAMIEKNKIDGRLF